MSSEYSEVSNFVRRARLISELVREFPHAEIIEIGARNCEMLEFIRNNVEGIEKAIAVDISEESLVNCSDIGFETLRADLNTDSLPYKKDTFDIAIATEIIEHLHHPYRIIGELRRVLKENGRLLVTVPNVARLRNRIGLLFGKDPTPVESPGIADVHIREFSLASISRLLEYNGFEVEQQSYIRFPGGNPLAILLKQIFPQLSTHICVVAKPNR